MLNDKNDVQFLNNDYVGKFDPEDEEMLENIDWFEEIDNGDLDDYSFENDFDELDLNDT